MVWAQAFQSIHDAIAADQRLVAGEEAALIAGDYATISRLGSRAR